MKWWKLTSIITLAAVLGGLGCGSSSPSTVSVTISPATASAIAGGPGPSFSASVNGSTNANVNWTVTCATGVAANTCGSLALTSTTANGQANLYTPPATIPTTTSNGTTVIAPTVTITATAQADTTKSAKATVTIVTGISINITPSGATVGTKEQFTFSATVSNPGCVLASNPTCDDVTWTVPTSTTTPNPNGFFCTPTTTVCKTGVYTAPATVPSPSTVIVTATSVADTSVTATATVSLVTAATPTVTSVSPNTTALGGLFQDVYITGTNFISTNIVYVNGAQLTPTNVSQISSSLIRARIPDYLLASPPASGFLQVSVSEQTGTMQTCSNASQCQIAVAPVRPGVIGPSPASVSQGGGVQSFNVDGGFFGTGANPASPAVTATYNGQLRGIQPKASQTTGSTRQLAVTIGGGSNPGDFKTPGLYPIAIRNAVDTSKFAATNLAVQQNYGITGITPLPNSPLSVGTKPSDVAINPATGIAVVTNMGSDNITLIDLTASTPAIVATICSGAVGSPSTCPTAGPTSVSVDYIRNIALVVNSTAKTIAVVDLNTKVVTNLISGFQDTPGAVGINPVTGRALVAMQAINNGVFNGAFYGVLLDLTQNPPAQVGVVSLSTGLHTRVAVEPHLNWALATPGGTGSVGIVDLNQESCNVIATLSRTTNVVQVTIQPAAACPSYPSAPLLAVRLNAAVQIQGAADATFNGIYQVTAIGPSSAQFSYTQTGATLSNGNSTGGTVSYAQPVAVVGLPLGVQGIGINPETQQAVFVNPQVGGVVTFFSLIDQSISNLALLTSNNSAETGTIAAAYNQLTNTAVAVNFFTDTLSVLDPTAPGRIFVSNQGDFGLNGPVAVAVDSGTDIAVVANQTGNSVSILKLDSNLSGSYQPFSITETSPITFVSSSTLGSGPQPEPQTLTIIGHGLTCTGGSTTLTVKLDDTPLQPACTGSGDRVLTATVPPNLLTTAHRYALEVFNSSTGAVTNAEGFLVEESVDVSSAACPSPQPSGVAIDPQLNVAAVSLFGCDSLALISLATGTGQAVPLGAGARPIGVAVIPRLQLAITANNGSASASIVDEVGHTVKATPGTGTGPIGAAADEATGEFAIANSVNNTVTVVNASTYGTHPISTGAFPVAVAFNYVNHQLAVAANGSNTLGVSDASASAASLSFNVSAPTSVAYDPVPSDCPSNGNATANTVGCFLVNSEGNNALQVIDSITAAQTRFSTGINPTSIAYNFLTSTLVSTNTASHTVTVADFLGQKVRAVLPLPPAPVNSSLAISGALQFALDIHPLSNLAVIADTANGKVLFVPLPY